MSWRDGLTPQQALAAKTPTRRGVLVAGAGSGKTKTMVARVRRLIEEEGVSRERILVVTFTEAAAREFKERVAGQGWRVPEVSTIHAWAAARLRRYAVRFGRTPTFSVYDEVDRELLIRSRARLLGVKNPDGAKLATLWKAPGVAASYEAALRGANAVDFDQLEQLAVAMLAELRDGRLEGLPPFPQYEHVIADEYQDTNPLQHQILTELAEATGAALYVVGDPRQAIYRFRGADPEIMAALIRDPSWEARSLDANFRSSPDVIGAANAIAGPEWTPMAATRPASTGDEVAVAHGADESTALDAIRVWSRGPNAGGRLAVLGRTWKQLDAIHEVLDGLGIPHTHHGPKTDFWATPLARLVANAVRLVANPADDNLCWVVGNVAPAEPVQASRSRSSLLAVVQDPTLVRLRMFTADTPLAQIAESVVENGAALVLEHLPEPDPNSVGPMTARGFTDWWVTRATDRRPGLSRTEAGINLLTVHAAKGLEYDHVVVLSAVEGVYPRHMLPETPDQRADHDEDGRVLYVAATRARSRLVFSCPPTLQRPYQEPIRVDRSPFLEHVAPIASLC